MEIKTRSDCLVCGKEMFVRPDKIALGEGKYCSQQCHGKVKEGKANPQWKGDLAKEKAIHRWVERHFPKPSICSKCGNGGWLDLHNLGDEYSRDLDKWVWLCRSCHMIVDGRTYRRIGGRYVSKEKINKIAKG